MDKWNEDQIERLRRIGNKKANQKWNPRKVPFPFDEDDKTGIDKWFREKYVLKKYTYGDPEPEADLSPSSVASPTFGSRHRGGVDDDDRYGHRNGSGGGRHTANRRKSNAFFDDDNDDEDAGYSKNKNTSLGFYDDDIYGNNNGHDSKDYYQNNSRSSGKSKFSSGSGSRFNLFSRNKSNSVSSPSRKNSVSQSKKDFDPSNLPTLTGRKISLFEEEVYRKEAGRFAKKTGINNMEDIIEALILAKGDNFTAFEIIKKTKKQSKRARREAERNGGGSSTASHDRHGREPENKPALPKRSGVLTPVKDDGDWLGESGSNNLLDDDEIIDVNDKVSKPVTELFDGDDLLQTQQQVPQLAQQQTTNIVDPNTGIVYAATTLNTGNTTGIAQQNPFLNQQTGVNPFVMGQSVPTGSLQALPTGNPFAQFSQPQQQVQSQQQQQQQQQPSFTGNPFAAQQTGFAQSISTPPQSNNSTDHISSKLSLNQLQQLKQQEEQQKAMQLQQQQFQQQQQQFQPQFIQQLQQQFQPQFTQQQSFGQPQFQQSQQQQPNLYQSTGFFQM